MNSAIELNRKFSFHKIDNSELKIKNINYPGSRELRRCSVSRALRIEEVLFGAQREREGREAGISIRRD